MRKIILSTMSLLLVLSLATPSVSAQGGGDPDPAANELAEHVPGEVLIRFSAGLNASQAASNMNEMGVTHKREIQGIGVHLVKLPPGLSVEQAIARFSRRPDVEFVEPNYILHIAETLQTEIVDQWGLTKIQTQEAWSTLNAGQKNEILLATVDTGINKDKSDLSPNIWTNPDETPNNGIDNDGNGYIDDTWGWDFVNNDNNPTDDHMHGSAVSSVMVAAQDGAGMVGICPWCKVMAVKVLDSQGSGSLDVVASGIIYAAQNGARVINLSLAGSIGSQTLENAVNFAWNQGSVVVAAAGNDGQRLTLYPAGYANAVAVASTNSTDKHSCFSNYNPGYISVAAPGEAIYVVDITNPTTGYDYYSGTSLSTPHVSGLAGLILGKDPNLSNAQVRSILEDSALDLGSSGVDAAFGHGRIDAYRAITGDTSQTTPPDGLSSASDTATGYGHARKLVRDSAGTLHLIWHSEDNSLYRIRYATSVDNGETWTLQPDVFSSPYETYHPALAADNTYLYAAIPSRGNASTPYQILFTRKPLTGGSWSTPVALMGGTYNAVRPDIYVDPTNGRLHLIASSLDDSPNLYYRASNTQGATWGSLSQFNPSGSTSYTRYASVYAYGDNIYIATRTVSPGLFTYYYLYTARSINGGATWIDQTQISWFLAFTSGEYGVSLAGVGDRLYMGYEVGSNLYFRRNDGSGWSNYLQLETGDASNVYKWPSITQADDGQAWMTFEVNGQLYMRHYDGVTWAPKESVGTGYFANLKRGVEGGLVEWVSTICNGSPFDLTYGSLNISQPPSVTLTVDKTGTGSGTVTSIPAGIDCGSDCTESYANNTSVTLTATLAAGSTFTGWSGGGCSGTGTCTVTLTADTTVSANFDPTPPTTGLYLSLSGNQTANGVASADEDILRFDGAAWSLFFDGSDVGVGGLDLYAFSVVDADTIVMSFNNAITLSGLAITPQDVVRFDATSLGTVTTGTFSMYLDGSDVGLEVAAERIDAVSLLPDGRVLISTTGNPAVAGITGARDEDVLALTPTSLGDTTSGSWAMYFDGSDVGLGETAGEDVDALDVVDGKVYLSTFDLFAVNGVSGADEDVFVCTPTSLGSVTACNYSATLYFDGSVWGLSANDVDAIDLLAGGSPSTATLSVNKTGAGNGTVSSNPAGIDCGVDCSEAYATNTSVTLTASPAAGSTFTGWSGGGCSGTGTCTVALTADTTVTANFNLQSSPTLTVNKTGAGNGTVSSSPAGIDCGSDCSEAYNSGTMVTLAASPSAGSTFTGWSGGGCSGTGTCMVTLSTSTTVTANFDLTSSTNVIFADGFESGSLSAWSSNTNDAGDLSVSPAAALIGSQGMQAVVDDANPIYVTDESPNAEPRYRVRFYFDPNSLTMAEGDLHRIFYAYSGTSTVVLRMELRRFSNSYQLRVGLLSDAGGWTNSGTFTISDAPHSLELDWRSATAAGADNGGLTFWIDGSQVVDLTGIDNDTLRIDRILLGAVNALDPGTSGAYFFDAFVSDRQNYIGP